ncbi:hypothetical protein D3C80_1562720 [compost metagenome]
MGQRLVITIAASQIQRIGVNLLRIAGLLRGQLTHQHVGLLRLPGLTQRLRIVIGQPDVIRILLVRLPVLFRRLWPLLALSQFVGLLFEHIQLQPVEGAA